MQNTYLYFYNLYGAIKSIFFLLAQKKMNVDVAKYFFYCKDLHFVTIINDI